MDQEAERAQVAAGWNARLARFRLEAGLNTRGQHVLSRVIIKRFAGDNAMVRYLKLDHPHAKSRLIGPDGAGKVRDFVPLASTSAEKLWAKTENVLPPALDLCDRDAVHANEVALTTLRDAMALHYIRSPQSRMTHARTYEQARESVTRHAWERIDWTTVFYRRYGLYPAGRGVEAFNFLMDDVLAEHDAAFESGLMFRDTLEQQFQKSKDWFSGRSVEILHPEVGEFLIGDNPTVTVSRDGRLGHGVGEVPLGDADQIVMPVGPHTLLAIGPKNDIGMVPEETVRVLNEWQVRAASRHVYGHPDSGLEDFVRRVRASAAPMRTAA